MFKILEYLFPPKLPVFNIKNDLPEIKNYQYRISRRGVDLNPALFYAGKAEAVSENSAGAEKEFDELKLANNFKLTYDSKTCPHCDANLVGPEIPLADQEMFGGKTHFSRLIGIETEDYDGVSFWKCPDCGQKG